MKFRSFKKRSSDKVQHRGSGRVRLPAMAKWSLAMISLAKVEVPPQAPDTSCLDPLSVLQQDCLMFLTFSNDSNACVGNWSLNLTGEEVPPETEADADADAEADGEADAEADGEADGETAQGTELDGEAQLNQGDKICILCSTLLELHSTKLFTGAELHSIVSVASTIHPSACFLMNFSELPQRFDPWLKPSDLSPCWEHGVQNGVEHNQQMRIRTAFSEIDCRSFSSESRQTSFWIFQNVHQANSKQYKTVQLAQDDSSWKQREPYRKFRNTKRCIPYEHMAWKWQIRTGSIDTHEMDILSCLHRWIQVDIDVKGLMAYSNFCHPQRRVGVFDVSCFCTRPSQLQLNSRGQMWDVLWEMQWVLDVAVLSHCLWTSLKCHIHPAPCGGAVHTASCLRFVIGARFQHLQMWVVDMAASQLQVNATHTVIVFLIRNCTFSAEKVLDMPWNSSR